MTEARRERWGAASGYAAIAAGLAGGAMERGSPTASAPAEEAVRYFADNRDLLLAQSLLFIISAGFFLWFLGSLRAFLIRAERGTGRLSAVVFGAGVAWVTSNAATQAPQIALAMASETTVEPELGGMISDLAYAFFTISRVGRGRDDRDDHAFGASRRPRASPRARAVT